MNPELKHLDDEALMVRYQEATARAETTDQVDHWTAVADIEEELEARGIAL